MNSKQRLLTALRGGQPDRVPISTYELVGHNSESFENQDPSYKRLMDVIRAKTDCMCMWNPGSDWTFLLSANEVEIESNVRKNNGSTTTRYTLRAPGGTLISETKVNDDVHTVWQTQHWCKTPADIDIALSVPFKPLTFDFSDLARARAEVGDHGIIMASVGDPVLYAASLMEFGEFTVWAMEEPEHFERTLRRLHEQNMENLRRMLDAGVVDLYRICGPEYVTPPFLPPACFQKYVQPFVKDIVELLHSRGALARVHSHGRIERVLDMIAATGADALDPCEPPPDGDIELADLKARVGKKMCLVGNIELKELENGTPARIDKLVEECMRDAKAGGGYIIMPTAAPINSPLSPKTEENYIRYIEAAERLGKY